MSADAKQRERETAAALGISVRRFRTLTDRLYRRLVIYDAHRFGLTTRQIADVIRMCGYDVGKSTVATDVAFMLNMDPVRRDRLYRKFPAPNAARAGAGWLSTNDDGSDRNPLAVSENAPILDGER